MPGHKFREELLRAALREAMLGSRTLGRAPPPHGADGDSQRDRRLERDRGRRLWAANAWRVEAAEFVRGILDTAALIQQARDTCGERVFRADAEHELVAALERIGGWPSIAEIARKLRVTKQAARQRVIAAARRGLLELVPDPHDRRSIQIGLTASGKRELAAARTRELILVTTLLGGLEGRDMRLVAHVLRVMRARLMRADRERKHG